MLTFLLQREGGEYSVAMKKEAGWHDAVSRRAEHGAPGKDGPMLRVVTGTRQRGMKILGMTDEMVGLEIGRFLVTA